ncbi:MAG: hypothetical protein PUP93_04645 [Rhizonema sp. NSF051]|nr:hypothetical protein [Rhizonema sp. NSF051]
MNNTINIWHIALLGVLQGIINAFDTPTRQAFIPETVSKENLSNAFALYSSLLDNLATSEVVSILKCLALLRISLLKI